MTTLRQAVLSRLTGDATLVALATGGIDDDDSLNNQHGLTLEDITSPTSPIIQPAVFVEWVSADPFGVHDKTLHAERLFLVVYFWQDTGYGTISAMKDRVKRLLHQQRVSYDTPANQYCYAMLWVGDVLDQKDPEMGGASLEWSRFEVHIRRKDY